ncbi:MAG: hypothetical protein HXS52_11475 [Theionarchaea archaeon]|nr:hypothetical protein [Theionarchaea archaeon]MBU7038541.1 hypothetical protein [Theionarchaea archaeon]
MKKKEIEKGWRTADVLGVIRMKRRLFTIRHWRIYKGMGICLIVSFFCSIPVITFYLGLDTAPAVIISLLLFAGWQLYYQGSAAEAFSRLFYPFEDEIKFDWIRFIISTQKESILYHFSSSPYSFWIHFRYSIPLEDAPPEHYQVWKETSWPSRIRVSPYSLREYLLLNRKWQLLLQELEIIDKLADTVSDELRPYFPREEISIASLRHIGLARRANKNILIALLTTDASLEEFQLVFSILDEIEDRIRGSNEPETW